MTTRQAIVEIQKHITNILDPRAIDAKKITGVAGDAPSQYSKSPALWNAAFRWLEMESIYLPFDVDDAHLAGLITVIRHSEQVLGINVTVPHKVKAVEYMDELDASAERINAVNTIVRTPAGRLVGYNTDGQGFTDSLFTPTAGRQASFVKSLQGIDVLLLGAGGSARAVAFHVADLLNGGELIICNRTLEHAQSLAEEVCNRGSRAKAISEEQIGLWASKVGLIINSTSKGQGGLRKLADGRVSTLEPYSALAPTHPPAFADHEFEQKWSAAAQVDIDANNELSIGLAKSIPQNVRFYDLIYYPEETVFLRHGRLTGHQTMNGKAMIIHQAALGFARYICAAELKSRGLDTPETFQNILKTMHASW
jgi:shikimate dehydrogenase